MLQKFAGGYYLRTYWVQRSDTVDEPRINKREYKKLKEKIYTEVPLVMKLRNKNFVVEGDETTPVQTLILNSEDLKDLNIERNPSQEDVILPKPSVIQSIYQI